jgi:sec-independent protein translocase protein TatA
MFGIGASELLIIIVVALLVVGPKRLPDLARSLGKGFSEFKKATEGVTEGIKDTLRADDIKENINGIKDSLLYGKNDTESPQPSTDPKAETPKKSDPYTEPPSGSHS